MSLKHGLLGLLNYGPMSGYDLDKAFKVSLSFFWQAKTSQIYRELDAMEQMGWLVSERVIQTDKPNKRVYSLSEKGKRELQDWLSSPGSDVDAALRVKSAFLMRVFFAGEIGVPEALELLRAYREGCARRVQGLDAAHSAIAGYGAGVANGPQFWKLTALYGELYYRLGVEWADKAIAMLEGEKP
jgi:DNA-binding PadR family transcriptional regulator